MLISKNVQVYSKLENDSIAMFVKAAPNVNAEKLAKITDEDIRVVYAQTGSTKVLTVSETGDALQGALPKITAKRGTPATIPTGEGVYFLQKVSKGADNGKYLQPAVSSWVKIAFRLPIRYAVSVGQGKERKICDCRS